MNTNRKIALVTGGGGFIGSSLVSRLVQEGYLIRVLSRSNHANDSSSLNTDIEYYPGDVSVYEDVYNACHDVDLVYHLAAAMNGDWDEHYKTTIQGTKNVLIACDRCGVQNLVYMSTINVYKAVNYPDNEVIDESFLFEDKPQYRGNYSNAKLQAEHLVRSHDYDKVHSLSVNIIRPGLVYGCKKNELPLSIGKLFYNKIVLLYSPRNKRLPVVYIDNLIDALILAGSIESGETQVFNVVDNDYPTQKYFLDLYHKITGRKLFSIYLPCNILILLFYLIDSVFNLIPNKHSSYVYKVKSILMSPIFSTNNIEDKLGWKQKIDFDTAIKSSLSK